ncbi:hypothetical protein ACH5RR_038899 [Cinchona calisaya]|uniref:FLZ-type domain-containing protein n=1 Tax=Cinchona calisaya TaxID=153742 RepID=A0ABD2XWM7_9GENT
MDSLKPAKRHCFVEEDDGLASITSDMDVGFSGNNHNLVSRPLYYNYNNMQRKNSLRNISSLSSSSAAAFVSSPRSVAAGNNNNSVLRFYEESHQAHFLAACFLCKKPLGGNKDIFMYRGDTPFCSEECRQEQIEMDEAKEKSLNLSSSMRALRKKDQKKSATSPNKQGCNFFTSTVAAA